MVVPLMSGSHWTEASSLPPGNSTALNWHISWSKQDEKRSVFWPHILLFHEYKWKYTMWLIRGAIWYWRSTLPRSHSPYSPRHLSAWLARRSECVKTRQLMGTPSFMDLQPRTKPSWLFVLGGSQSWFQHRYETIDTKIYNIINGHSGYSVLC